MIFHDAAHNGQAYAGAGDVAHLRPALKQLEGFLLKQRLHAHAIVAHPQRMKTRQILPADFKAKSRFGPAILERITE